MQHVDAYGPQRLRPGKIIRFSFTAADRVRVELGQPELVLRIVAYDPDTHVLTLAGPVQPHPNGRCLTGDAAADYLKRHENDEGVLSITGNGPTLELDVHYEGVPDPAPGQHAIVILGIFDDDTQPVSRSAGDA